MSMFPESRSQFDKERFDFWSFGDCCFVAEFPDSFVDVLNFQGERFHSETTGKNPVVTIQEGL